MNTPQNAPSFDFPSDVTFADDLDVALNSAEYRDPAPPLPLYAGNYGVKFTQVGLKRKRDEQRNPTNELVLINNAVGVPTYPVIEIKQVTVVAPEDTPGVTGKVVYPFQEFPTNPTTKRDFNAGGAEFPYNHLSAIIRSHDASINFGSLAEGLELFKTLSADGAVFYINLDWRAEDRKWIGEQIKAIDEQEKAGQLSAEEAKTLRGEIRYKKGRLEGFKKFVVNGEVTTEWEGPSGDMIPARPFIRDFISTLQIGKPYKLGPRRV